MTVQTALIDTFDYGASLDSATARVITTDTLVATATSTNRVTGAGSGLFAIVFDLASVIAAGTYRLRAVFSGQPITRYVTFAGVDSEVVQSQGDAAGISGGGGDATLAKQTEILAAIQGSEVIQVASPNVLGNLVLTQGDNYDSIANPRAQWNVTTDYTDGWSVTLTIRDADDAVVYTTSGTVVSATVIAVTIAAPTGLTMTGCPGQWQGKFDVQLTKAGSTKTIALGTCYINEDQTR